MPKTSKKTSRRKISRKVSRKTSRKSKKSRKTKKNISIKGKKVAKNQKGGFWPFSKKESFSEEDPRGPGWKHSQSSSPVQSPRSPVGYSQVSYSPENFSQMSSQTNSSTFSNINSNSNPNPNSSSNSYFEQTPNITPRLKKELSQMNKQILQSKLIYAKDTLPYIEPQYSDLSNNMKEIYNKSKKVIQDLETKIAKRETLNNKNLAYARWAENGAATIYNSLHRENYR